MVIACVAVVVTSNNNNNIVIIVVMMMMMMMAIFQCKLMMRISTFQMRQVNGTDGRLSHWKVPDDDASLRLQRETDFLK